MKKIATTEGINSEDFVTVTRMNHISEVQYLEKKTPHGFCPIRVISGDHYIKAARDANGDIITYKTFDEHGKKMLKVVYDEDNLFDFNKSENRSQNTNSLKRTMKRLRYKINNTFTGEDNELFITLTYAENMTDTKRLYKDCDLFIKKIKKKFSAFEVQYINVIEPQSRGAWHCHILFKLVGFNKKLFIPNSVISDLWGHGYTKVKKIDRKNVDNIGAYLTSYLTDIEVADSVPGAVEKKVLEDGKLVTKKFKKGGRLHLYPANMNFYRCSRNCGLPTRLVMKYKDFIKTVVGKMVYSTEFLIVDDNAEEWAVEKKYNGKYLNRLRFEVYNDLAKNG